MSKTGFLKILLAGALAAAAGPARAEEASGSPLKLPKVVSATLDNGMRILVLERHDSPTVAFNIRFKVGSVNDQPGKTGLAHMFEHMIFKGTKTINTKDYAKEKPVLDEIEKTAQEMILEQAKREPDASKVKALQDKLASLQKEAEQYEVPDEYERLYTQQGATGFNAYTASDFTAYVLSLPANKLEMWMAIEADRFKNPVLREFYKERAVVMEERRMSYESRPDGKLWEAFVSAAFVAHPYRDVGIGWMSDLKHLTATDAEAFFQKYYGPNNAVAAIVGDVDAKKVIELCRKYFSDIPSRPVPPDLLTQEPPQDGERRVKVRFDAQPQLMLGYKGPDVFSPDEPALEMISGILSDGRTGRFYKHLVEGKKLALDAGSDTHEPGVKYPGLFMIGATPRHPATNAQLEAAIYDELEAFKKAGPTAWEMDKFRNSFEAGLVGQLESNAGMADKLSYDEAVIGDWRRSWQLLEHMRALKPEDLTRVAKDVFKPETRTVAELEAPSGSASAAPEEVKP